MLDGERRRGGEGGRTGLPLSVDARECKEGAQEDSAVGGGENQGGEELCTQDVQDGHFEGVFCCHLLLRVFLKGRCCPVW